MKFQNFCLYILTICSLTSCFDKTEVKKSDNNPEEVIEVTVQEEEEIETTHHSKVDITKLNYKFPLLIIEKGGVLWNEGCYDNDELDFDGYKHKALEWLETDSIISIGKKGIQKQNLLNIYCMPGECGTNQLALELEQTENFGVLMNARYNMDTIDFKVLNQLKFKNNDTTFLEVIKFATARGDLKIEIAGIGEMQENNWPYFQSIKWRIVHKNKKSNWIEQRHNSTNLPIPIAVSYNNNQAKVIWYLGEGICCPSRSVAWLSSFQIKNDSIYNLINHDQNPGGLGQGCD